MSGNMDAPRLPDLKSDLSNVPATNELLRGKRRTNYSAIIVADPNNNKRSVAAWSTLPRSGHSARTINPIRRIADRLDVPPNPLLAPIKLHLGDPSLSGRLPPCKNAVKALEDSLHSEKNNGYFNACGSEAARQAVVDRYSSPEAPFTSADVILASGASHALQMAIEAIAGPGDNILVPQPGFPLYGTLMKPHGIEEIAYRLKMESDASPDLEDLVLKITPKTKAIIVNNPGNPTGAVFSREVLLALLRIASTNKLVIIADEIYGDLTFGGAEFYPMASLTDDVPVITCDGIAKRWMVPGWRLGWSIIHDRHNVLKDVKDGMVALSQKIVGPCSLVQGALPAILKDTPQEYFEYNKRVIHENSTIVVDALSEVAGLRPIAPAGSMYMMVEVDRRQLGDEVTFVQGLIREQSVFCLPGSAFGIEGYFRVVLTSDAEHTREACERITEYCRAHRRDERGYESDEGVPGPIL